MNLSFTNLDRIYVVFILLLSSSLLLLLLLLFLLLIIYSDVLINTMFFHPKLHKKQNKYIAADI